MRLPRWMVYAVVYSFYLSTLAFGAEVRKVTRQDIEWTTAASPSTDCTVTSAGGHVGNVLDNAYQLSAPYVDVRAYGAALSTTNGTDNWTTAISDAITAASTGVVLLPRGTFAHSGITIPAGVTLIGFGPGATTLKYTGATGDGITFGANPDRAGLMNVSLAHSGSTTGWAINASSGTQREITIQNVMIGGALKGIYIVDGINVGVHTIRITGQGKTTAGGIGIQIGTALAGGNGTTVSNAYVSSFEAGIINYGSTTLLSRPILESCTTGLTAQARTTVVAPWVGTNTTDVSVQAGAVNLFGYGSQNYSITYATATERNRSVVIPDTFDFASSAGVARIGTVTMGRDEGLIETHRGQRIQSFILQLRNVSGILKHNISADGSMNALGNYSDAIIGASADLQIPPTGTDSSTDFTTGVKISSADNNTLIFNTANQVIADGIGSATVEYNDTGTQVAIQMLRTSRNVNGTTIIRPELAFYNDNTGTAFSIDNTNIPTDKRIKVKFFGYLVK